MKQARHEPGLPFRPRYRVRPVPQQLRYASVGGIDPLPLSRALRLGSAMGICCTLVAAFTLLVGWVTDASGVFLCLALPVVGAAAGLAATVVGALRRRSRGWALHLLVGLAFNAVVLVPAVAYIASIASLLM